MYLPHYSKTNELKLKYNDKDWNNPEVQVTMYMELDRAKSEGFVEALEMINKDDVFVPKEIIKDILRYCEHQSVYDKLGCYGDFYYKLKNLINGNK